MFTFFLRLWFHFVAYVTVYSLLWGAVLAVVITAITYFLKGAIALDADVQKVLLELAIFYFPFTWGVSFLVSMFMATRTLFYRKANGYMYELYNCDRSEKILDVTLDDALVVWRKMLFGIIWLVTLEVLLGMILSFMLSPKSPLFWFNIYYLYVFIMIAVFVLIAVMPFRCRRVKLIEC
ncbi:MAG: hypothetical protein GQ570_06260 [Helicobacteraceae bacterium]|nr:hypothetical protein [Helicobacteraceae bacterium]